MISCQVKTVLIGILEFFEDSIKTKDKTQTPLLIKFAKSDLKNVFMLYFSLSPFA
jgi:hypothetical protein